MADIFDLVIIGAGPGGYVAAIKGAKLGLSVAVVENREVGGTCLNRGCIPAKAMIHASQLYREMKEGGQFGIFAENVRYEYDKILEYKEGTSGSLRQGVEQLFKANNVTLVKGTGTLQADKTVLVTGCEGEEESRVLKGTHVLLASGSKPMNLPIEGLDLPGVLTSDGLLELQHAPESLLIIGGGVIGAEFASVFSSLGIRVTIVEALPRLLANLDKDISQNLKMILKKRGIKIYTGAMVKRIEKTEHGLACVFEEKGEEKREEADYVLSAAGRVPETEKLLGPGTELAMERGRITVDSNFETSMEGVYAIGDVIKGIQLAHVASAQGVWVAEHLAGTGHSIDLSVVPSCVYTSPEIASVGLTEEEAAQAGIPVSVGKFLMSANGKSQISREERGFIKIIAEADTKVVLGAQMMCARATDMIGEMATAVANKLTVPQLLLGMRAHPTYNEAVGEALEELEGGSIHTVPRQVPGKLKSRQ